MHVHIGRLLTSTPKSKSLVSHFFALFSFSLYTRDLNIVSPKPRCTRIFAVERERLEPQRLKFYQILSSSTQSTSELESYHANKLTRELYRVHPHSHKYKAWRSLVQHIRFNREWAYFRAYATDNLMLTVVHEASRNLNGEVYFLLA